MRGDLLALGIVSALALGTLARRGSRQEPDDAWDDFVEANESFLYGRCVTLAIALHRLTGLPLYGVTAVDEDEDGNGRVVLLHAYVRRGKEIIDLRGARSYDDMLADFSHDNAFGCDMDESRMDEETLAKLATGRRRCPSLKSAVPVAAAVWARVQGGSSNTVGG